MSFCTFLALDVRWAHTQKAPSKTIIATPPRAIPAMMGGLNLELLLDAELSTGRPRPSALGGICCIGGGAAGRSGETGPEPGIIGLPGLLDGGIVPGRDGFPGTISSLVGGRDPPLPGPEGGLEGKGNGDDDGGGLGADGDGDDGWLDGFDDGGVDEDGGGGVAGWSASAAGGRLPLDNDDDSVHH